MVSQWPHWVCFGGDAGWGGVEGKLALPSLVLTWWKALVLSAAISTSSGTQMCLLDCLIVEKLDRQPSA